MKMNGCRMKVMRCVKVCKGDDGLVCENDGMVCEGERGVRKVCEDDQMVLKLKGWCVGVGNDRV